MITTLNPARRLAVPLPRPSQKMANVQKPAATPAGQHQMTLLPEHHKARIAPQLKFGHKLTAGDYVVSPDPDSSVNAYTASKTLRALMFRDLYKQEEGDPSHLKLVLGMQSGNSIHGNSALADSLMLLNRPVDTIIDSTAGTSSVPALLMPRIMNNLLPEGVVGRPTSLGKRYIGRHSSLQLGPIGMVLGGNNHTIQIDREMLNEDFQMQTALVMLATGETDRNKVIRDLNGNETFNALQALAYGKQGLVDAILVGESKILTREGLNDYYKTNRFTPEDIEEFNEDPLNLDRILDDPSSFKWIVPLKTFAPNSTVPEAVLSGKKRVSPYFTPSSAKETSKSPEPLKIGSPPSADSSRLVTGPDSVSVASRPTSIPVLSSSTTSATSETSVKPLKIHIRGLDSDSFKPLGKSQFLNTSIGNQSDIPAQFQIGGIQNRNSFLYDDLILFNDGFDMETADQIASSLQALKVKKEEAPSPSHIKLLINSGGGQVKAAIKLSNELEGMGRIKTDVVVNGMAASCGAWLLAKATGNRLATPQARIMIHQPSIGLIDGATNLLANQSADNINILNKRIAGEVAKATGRDRKLVEKDMRQDTWLNPLESMFYGNWKADKGLLDAILVGPNHAITRQDVLDYLETDTTTQAFLTKKFGPGTAKANVENYIEDRLSQFCEPRADWKKADPRDPFNDPLRTIVQVASTRAKNLVDIPSLAGSVTRTDAEERNIDHFAVGRFRSTAPGYWNAAPSTPASTPFPQPISVNKPC